MAYRFETDTTSQQLEAAWNIGDKPNGGYVMAASARRLWDATQAAGANQPHPITVSTHYMRPCDVGAYEHSAEVLRIGRTVSTAQGSLTQGGKVRVHTLATFGDVSSGGGLSHERGGPPDLPPIDECVERGDGFGPTMATPLGDVVETRLHPGTGWIHAAPTGIPRVSGWTRFRDGQPPDPWSLLFFADALPPTMFELLPERVWVPTIELTVHVRALPTSMWLKASFVTNHVTNGRFEEDGELWDDNGTLVAQSRQLAMVLAPSTS
jgi:acyl-CoA thioesterase